MNAVRLSPDKNSVEKHVRYFDSSVRASFLMTKFNFPRFPPPRYFLRKMCNSFFGTFTHEMWANHRNRNESRVHHVKVSETGALKRAVWQDYFRYRRYAYTRVQSKSKFGGFHDSENIWFRLHVWLRLQFASYYIRALSLNQWLRSSKLGDGHGLISILTWLPERKITWQLLSQIMIVIAGEIRNSFPHSFSSVQSDRKPAC